MGRRGYPPEFRRKTLDLVVDGGGALPRAVARAAACGGDPGGDGAKGGRRHVEVGTMGHGGLQGKRERDFSENHPRPRGSAWTSPTALANGDAWTSSSALNELVRKPHWEKIWSTNPLERLNKEIKRRTGVVGVFPNDAALLRLTACVLIEGHDEWAAGDRRYLSEASMAALRRRCISRSRAAGQRSR